MTHFELGFNLFIPYQNRSNDYVYASFDFGKINTAPRDWMENSQAKNNSVYLWHVFAAYRLTMMLSNAKWRKLKTTIRIEWATSTDVNQLLCSGLDKNQKQL